MTASLFDVAPDVLPKGATPLAERLRPRGFTGVVGQDHLTNEGMPLARMLERGELHSVILWGPAGCGKTTIARILAAESGYNLETISAVISGTAELRKIFERASLSRQQGQRTVLFVDEIHRFNRAQQDVFLPYVEDGTIVLIGATTENPSFELNAALLSRCQVLVLKRLDEEALDRLVAQAEETEERRLPVTEEARTALLAMADGDGRYLLNLCEELFGIPNLDDEALDPASLANFVQHRLPVYDKHQESHYNLISALHKSLRGSDAQAALYWLSRMLQGGDDPMYILRRLVRFAVEDIGLADPQALPQAVAARDAYHFLGSPEGELAIAQAVLYLATAPKSNAGYAGFNAAWADAKKFGSLMPPKHILNAPTKLMKELGYSEGYAYDHATTEGFSGQNYFPDGMDRREYYQPAERGFEREVKKRLEYWGKLRKEKAA